MRVLFQNHSSILLQHDDKYLLTDPWYDAPAFGSWLPSVPPYIHPVYFASLEDRLSILISHGHDDHFDEKFLKIFSKNTKFISANFKSPSVIGRLKRLGFENITQVSENEKKIDGLFVSSYINPEVSNDDALYLIRNQDGAIIHANDNWNNFLKLHEKLIKERTKNYAKKSILLFSQTNSASGYPLNYRNLKFKEKQTILKEKVLKMVKGGLRNAETLGLKNMFSYAGYASAYVKGKKYVDEGLFPTSKYLINLLKENGIKNKINIPELYPGDFITLPDGKINKAFIYGYEDSKIKEFTNKYYELHNMKNECLSYRKLELSTSNFEKWIEFFLVELDFFSRKRIVGPDKQYKDLIGKELSMEIHLANSSKLCKTIKFGHGLVNFNNKANKICFVDEPVIFSVLKGESLFEDLYTGYNAEWARYPANVFNRDIIMMIVMYSYVYKNRISKSAKNIFYNKVFNEKG